MKLNNAVMNFVHQPARLLEVDFAGDPLHYVDRSSGELIVCPVYVAVLPFSGNGYVEVLPETKIPQVVKALNHILDYPKGLPMSVKPNNMRQWVVKSCKYEPNMLRIFHSNSE